MLDGLGTVVLLLETAFLGSPARFLGFGFAVLLFEPVKERLFVDIEGLFRCEGYRRRPQTRRRVEWC